jgi:hypothetical protein
MENEASSEKQDDVSRMFLGEGDYILSDEELALHLMHRFNIDRETIETMPAFEKHLENLFSLEKEK